MIAVQSFLIKSTKIHRICDMTKYIHKKTQKNRQLLKEWESIKLAG